jgi:hypothetical protein
MHRDKSQSQEQREAAISRSNYLPVEGFSATRQLAVRELGERTRGQVGVVTTQERESFGGDSPRQGWAGFPRAV